MSYTARELREALHLLDDDEIIYIEKADNLIHSVKGISDYARVEDEGSIPSKTPNFHYEAEEAKYLNVSRARWVEKLNSDGTVSDKDIFVIEANE